LRGRPNGGSSPTSRSRSSLSGSSARVTDSFRFTTSERRLGTLGSSSRVLSPTSTPSETARSFTSAPTETRRKPSKQLGSGTRRCRRRTWRSCASTSRPLTAMTRPVRSPPWVSVRRGRGRRAHAQELRRGRCGRRPKRGGCQPAPARPDLEGPVQERRLAGLRFRLQERGSLLWKLRDGKIINVALYQDPSEALEVAGLRG